MDNNKNIEQKVPLAGLSTFKAGGPASYLWHITSEGEVAEALDFAREKALNVLILGGGSNMLFPEDGFNGLVIKLEIKGIDAKEDGADVLVTAKAGEEWDAFVAWTLDRGYFGLENLSSIPGTVGAAPIQNIGAYGVEAKDMIEAVEVYDTEKGAFRQLTAIECGFGYRTSIFKKDEGKKLIVTAVTWKLSKVPQIKIGYKDLANHFEGKDMPSPTDVRKAVIGIRRGKFPDLSVYGTAGSFWKNVICDRELADELKDKYPDMPIYDADNGRKKISTAYILDKVCGLKNFREGSVGLYANQTLVVTNYGGATAEEIKSFVEKVKNIVKEKTNIELEEEVVMR
jgi:UDP-N-acetylmuramate dehydrogenase